MASVTARAALRDMVEKIFAEFGEPALTGTTALEGELCEAAAVVSQLAPWRVLHETDIILIESDDVAITHPVAVVIGSGGETEGVVLYRSIEAMATLIDSLDDTLDEPWENSSDHNSPFLSLQDTLSVIFYKHDEVPSEIRHAFQELHLVVARGRFPQFVRTHIGGDVTGVRNPEEARVLLTSLEALAAFFEDHLEAFEQGYPERERRLTTSQGYPVTARSVPPLRELFFGDEIDRDIDGDIEALASVPSSLSMLLDFDTIVTLTTIDADFVFERADHVRWPSVTSSLGHPMVPAVLVRSTKAHAGRAAKILDDADTVAVTLVGGGSFGGVVAFQDNAPMGWIHHWSLHCEEEQLSWFRSLLAATSGRAALVFSGGGTSRPHYNTTPRAGVALQPVPVLL